MRDGVMMTVLLLLMLMVIERERENVKSAAAPLSIKVHWEPRRSSINEGA